MLEPLKVSDVSSPHCAFIFKIIAESESTRAWFKCFCVVFLIILEKLHVSQELTLKIIRYVGS